MRGLGGNRRASFSEPDPAVTGSCCPDWKGHLSTVLRSWKNTFHAYGNRKGLPGLAEGLADAQGTGPP